MGRGGGGKKGGEGEGREATPQQTRCDVVPKPLDQIPGTPSAQMFGPRVGSKQGHRGAGRSGRQGRMPRAAAIDQASCLRGVFPSPPNRSKSVPLSM
jgi:hypothetical protein